MKRVSLVLIMVVILSMMFSCSRVQAGPMESLIGTYELIKYYREYNDKTEEKEATKIDFLEEKKIEMYLVVTGSDVGYISYKDNDTTLFVKEVNLSYDYDSEDTDYINTISYTLPNTQAGETVQNGWSYLGFLSREHALNVNDPKITTTGSCANNNIQFKTEYRDHLYLNRASKDNDLTYIKGKYGEVNVINLALSKIKDKYACSAQTLLLSAIPSRYNDLIFEAFEFSIDRRLATKYYATKTDKTLVSQQFPVSITYTEDNADVYSMTFDGITYLFDGLSFRCEETVLEETKTAYYYFMIDDLTNYGNDQISIYQQS